LQHWHCLATMYGLPGFIADDIAALLRDLPLPAACDVMRMTVEPVEVPGGDITGAT